MHIASLAARTGLPLEIVPLGRTELMWPYQISLCRRCAEASSLPWTLWVVARGMVPCPEVKCSSIPAQGMWKACLGWRVLECSVVISWGRAASHGNALLHHHLHSHKHKLHGHPPSVPSTARVQACPWISLPQALHGDPAWHWAHPLALKDWRFAGAQQSMCRIAIIPGFSRQSLDESWQGLCPPLIFWAINDGLSLPVGPWAHHAVSSTAVGRWVGSSCQQVLQVASCVLSLGRQPMVVSTSLIASKLRPCLGVDGQ